MGIVFFCRSCGARFESDPRMAGKRGRCRKCGQHTTIPRPEELSVLAAAPVPPASLSSGAGAADGTATAARGVGRATPSGGGR